MKCIALKKLSAALTLFFFWFTSLFLAPKVFAEIPAVGIDISPVQYSTIKEFSGKFCDALVAGLNRESALIFSAPELYKPIMSPSIWSNVVPIKGKNIKGFSSEKMTLLASANIAERCSKELQLSDQGDFKSFNEYLSMKLQTYLPIDSN